MRDPVCSYIGLGANLGANVGAKLEGPQGDAAHTVLWAMAQIASLPQTQVLATSSLYTSAPVDASGPDYTNAVLSILTRYSAPGLLEVLQKIEHLAGRERPYRNAPRTLDLDLLLYGDACIDSPLLQIPHPRMWTRAFVLHPLAEIAPERVSPERREGVRGQDCRRV